MENENFKLKKPGNYTITHRKGLDQKPPVQIAIVGNIDSVTNFLSKRVIVPDTFDDDNVDELKINNVSEETAEQQTNESSEHNEKMRMLESMRGLMAIITSGKPDADNKVDQHEAHVLINREDLSILLVIHESHPFMRGTVQGRLVEHPDFAKWNINTGEEWTNKKLSEFIKMNRSCFADKNDAMRLSAELANLRVKVDKEIEKSNDNRANIREMLSQQVIAMNIPQSFVLQVPVFKGQPAQTFEVEIYVNPGNFQVSLVSPDANDLIAQVRDSIIDEQKALIQSIAPNLVIIEQ